jgi:hypothetical protein
LGWSTGAGTRPTIPLPGGCDTSASGVQFVFGGDSQWNVTAGKVELCPQPSQTTQRIAVFGLKSGSTSATGMTAVASSASSTSYSPAANGVTINGSVATATLPATNPASSASITLTATNGIPAGSTITSASLRVAHYDTNDTTTSATTNIGSIQATITPATGTGSTVNVPFEGTLTTDTITLLPPGSNNYSDLSSFTLQYTVTSTKNKTVSSRLDGMDLVVTYVPVGFEAQSGCIVNRPYVGNASACAFLKTSGTASFVMQGTVYAPLAPVDIALTSESAQVFGRGLISWVIRLNAIPASGFTSALAQTPDDSGTRADRQVLFTATESGTTWARALVTFTDGGGSTPGATVTVNSWSVTHGGS